MPHDAGNISAGRCADMAVDCQRTIADCVQVQGFGYWSGKDVTVEFRPAKADSGITFVRADLDKPVFIPALVENRIESPLRTTLKKGGAQVEMIEHIMAALSGLGIDNCEIWVDAQEMPGCDGSALDFVQALDRAGRVTLPASRRQLVIREATRLGTNDSWVEAKPSPHGEYSVMFRLDYPDAPAIGRQTIKLPITPETFRRDLAPCRTFMQKQEAEWLQSQGLGSRVTYQDLLVFDEHGPIDNEVRFENECARHKALDVVGDLALAGCHIVGELTAYRSGHRLNAELVRVLLQEGNLTERKIA